MSTEENRSDADHAAIVPAGSEEWGSVTAGARILSVEDDYETAAEIVKDLAGYGYSVTMPAPGKPGCGRRAQTASN